MRPPLTAPLMLACLLVAGAVGAAADEVAISSRRDRTPLELVAHRPLRSATEVLVPAHSLSRQVPSRNSPGPVRYYRVEGYPPKYMRVVRCPDGVRAGSNVYEWTYFLLDFGFFSRDSSHNPTLLMTSPTLQEAMGEMFALVDVRRAKAKLRRPLSAPPQRATPGGQLAYAVKLLTIAQHCGDNPRHRRFSAWWTAPPDVTVRFPIGNMDLPEGFSPSTPQIDQKYVPALRKAFAAVTQRFPGDRTAGAYGQLGLGLVGGSYDERTGNRSIPHLRRVLQYYPSQRPQCFVAHYNILTTLAARGEKAAARAEWRRVRADYAVFSTWPKYEAIGIELRGVDETSERGERYLREQVLKAQSGEDA